MDNVTGYNDKARLDDACNALARAIKAQEKRDNWTVVNKGKTLISINRSRQSTVKFTVNF